jgi:hypothetical protein
LSLRLKLLKWNVHCSNPLVRGSNPLGGAKILGDTGRIIPADDQEG